MNPFLLGIGVGQLLLAGTQMKPSFEVALITIALAFVLKPRQ